MACVIFARYETKYFNLKRDILYFYKDKNSEFSQGSYKLKEMSGFGKTENEDCGFYLVNITPFKVVIKNRRSKLRREKQKLFGSRLRLLKKETSG